MAWCTKGSRRSYNSNCGYSRLVGGHTKKVISSVVYCQVCRICKVAEQKKRTHESTIVSRTMTAVSKEMESAAALEMAVKAPEQGFVLATIVSDDDSKIRAHLKHAGVGENKGKLPLWIYSPAFLADPSHKQKMLQSIFMRLQVPLCPRPGSQMSMQRG